MRTIKRFLFFLTLLMLAVGGLVVMLVLRDPAAAPVGTLLVIMTPLILLPPLLLWAVSALSPKPQGHYHAHFAASSEVRDMAAPPTKGRGGEEGSSGVLLARHQGGLIELRPGFDGRSEMGHFLVCGPSRSGKGLHLTSNLLRWGGSAIVLDIKGELYRLTAEKRRALGNEVLVLDPSGRGDRYDPFGELSYSPEALRSAVNIVMEPEKGRESIFAERAADALYAAVLAARKEGAPALAYVDELMAEGPRAFVERLDALGDVEIRRALVRFLGDRPEDMEPRDYRTDRFLSSTWSTMTTRLGPLLSDGVLRTTGGSDFVAADLVERPTTLYLMFGEAELRYTSKLFQLITLSILTGLIRRGDLEPEGGGVPLLVCFDEAGRTPIPRLDDLVSTIAGRGMGALVYVQDLGQLDGAYGRERAQTIRGNCHTQLYYRPTDQDTAAHVSRLSGLTSVEEVRMSRDWGGYDDRQSVGMRQRELITADEVRGMEHDEVIVFAGAKPPIRARRLEWFHDVPGAAEFVRDNPPPEPRPLPRPEVRLSRPPARAQDRGEEPRVARPRPARPGRSRAEEEGRGGYFEPDF